MMRDTFLGRALAFLQRRGTRDVAWSLAGSAGAMIVGVATTMLLARQLGPAFFGILSVALAIVFTIAGLADWGLSIAFVRLASPEVMAGRSIRHLHSVFLGLRLALAGIVTLAILFAADRFFPRIHLPTEYRWLGPAAAAAGLALAAGGHYTAVLQVLRWQRTLTLVRLGASLGRLGAYALWALLATRRLDVALAIALIAVVGEAALAGWFAHRGADLWPPVARRPPSAWLAFSFWAAVPAIAYNLIGQTDTVLLAVLAGPEQTGIWAAISRISGVLVLASGAAWQVALPYVTALPDRSAVARYARLAGLWCAGLAVATLAAVVLAPLLIRILYGQVYAEGTGALRLLLAGHAIGSALLLLIPLAYRFRRERLVAAAGVAQFVVNLGGDIVLIPRYGATGSATATLLMYVAAGLVLVPAVASDIVSPRPLPPAAEGAGAEVVP